MEELRQTTVQPILIMESGERKVRIIIDMYVLLFLVLLPIDGLIELLKLNK